MRTLYVVTHPEATHHVDGLVGGWYDSHLTPAGHRVADALARTLRARIPAEAAVELYSSDLARTRQTATPIAEAFGAAPRWDARLREKSYGVAGGRPQAWLDERFVPPPAVGERMHHDEGVEGAETKAQWVRRLYAVMDDVLRSRCPHQIVVTHGGSLTFVVASWIGMPLDALDHVSFRAPSGSITTLREDDFFHNRQLVSLGERPTG